MAEVAARFTLDAMPGKQMSIDADLNAGVINDEEARRRRKEVQVEADFYGSMDGASKFVKGDSVAAIVVMLVNLIGGFIIGMVMGNMNFTEALQHYALLTVGAGLATQIPSLLVSAASGLIVTRTASDAPLGTDILGQLGNLNTFIAGSVILFVIGLIPGMPKLPFFLVAGIMGITAYFLWKSEHKVIVVEERIAEPAKPTLETPDDLMKLVVVDPMELEVGYGLIPLVDEERVDNLLRQITNIRRQVLNELGIVLPVIRIRDNLRLSPNEYRIKIRGEEISRSVLYVERYMAIPGAEIDKSIVGEKTTEPAFGLPAIWIGEAEKGRAELVGYTLL